MKNYTVLFMTTRTEINPQGQFIKIKDIQFQTLSGVTDSIKIPENLFTREYAEKLLDDKTAEIDAVMNLGRTVI